jgi:hypothetical protein
VSYAELADLVTFRPLSMALPAPTFDGWSGSPFRASWTDTVGLLLREHLKPRETLIEIDVREQDIRLDGMPRANAVQQSPGVVLTLIGTPHGDLRYPCSTYRTWQANVRAIALALEALRKVDRYGVTKRGEQYAGWKALPAGDDEAQRGRDLIREHGGVSEAIKATHPDHGGDADEFRAVLAARVEA